MLITGKEKTITGMLDDVAGRQGNQPAVFHNDRVVTYGEFRQQALAIAAYLTSVGVCKGDRVGLLLEKSPDAMICFLAVAYAGGIVFPIDYHYPPVGLQYLLDLTAPTALIVASALEGKLDGLRVPCPDRAILVFGEPKRPGRTRAEDIVHSRSIAPPTCTGLPSDPVYLNFTSGTTGFPKGAITTHSNIYWNTRSAAEALQLQPDDVHLCMFPVFGHPHEFFARPLYLGGAAVLVDGVAPRNLCQAITRHGVTSMMAVASIYGSVGRYDRFAAFNASRLRICESGGMHINSELAHLLTTALKPPAYPVWGSTETTGIALLRPVDGPFRTGSVGRPCPYYDIRLLDEAGNEAATGEPGELTVRGPGVCESYYRNDDETARHMRDGWVHTHDLFRRDDNGYFYFAGRRSGMIKCAGLKVFPTEIEEVLCRHPSILEVAVAGVPDRSHGEVPKAYIVLRDGQATSESDILKYCERHLAKYKVPRVIQFLADLPKTETGKVLYQKLRDAS